MENLLKFILENLVDHPDDIKIESEESDHGYIVLKLTVHPDDMGKVIGKNGKIISAIRKILRVKAMKLGKRINLDLQEPQS